MPINLYFNTKFAQGGTVVTVPDSTQSDGSVSYNEGYGVFYTQDPAVNPTTALNIEETNMNQIFQDITAAIQYIQQNGAPAFITSSMNGGTSFSYSKGAIVAYDPGSGLQNYFSLVAANTTLPTSASWTPLAINAIVFYGGTTAGTVNAQTATAPNFTLVAGNSVFVIFGNTNTGALQLNITGTGLTNAYKASASGPIPCIGGEAIQGNIGLFTFDGTEYQFVNPQPVSSSSAIQSLINVQAFTSNGTWTKPTGCNAVEIQVVGGGGGGAGSGANGVNGGTSSFGSVLFASGGGQGTTSGSVGGNGGTGTGSGLIYSIQGQTPIGSGTIVAGGLSSVGTSGQGGAGNAAGGGGGYAYGYMAASGLGTTVSCTVGAGGTGGSGVTPGISGSTGIIIVKSYK